MENCRLKIVLICLTVCLVNSTPHRMKSGIVQKFHRTGEAIATDDLITKYELEHQKFYEEEIKENDYLEWPTLDKKDLSKYCTKYLQYSIPNKIIDATIGIKILRTLNYEKANTNITNTVVAVKCKLIHRLHHAIFYYVTRTPEPNCAYALKCNRIHKELLLTIINKYCDFEEKPLINMSIKRKRKEIVSNMHRRTGQPIAKDEYLLKYELEHHEMIKGEKKSVQNSLYEWPHKVLHDSLDFYCYKYMGQCVPGRNRKGIKGIWKIEKLRYQKLDINEDISVTTVTCIPSNPTARHYYITRAPETNCVYALIREQCTINDPLKIIFKHCNFEDPVKQETISQEDNTIDRTVITKTEVKEEIIFDIMETHQFFQID